MLLGHEFWTQDLSMKVNSLQEGMLRRVCASLAALFPLSLNVCPSARLSFLPLPHIFALSPCRGHFPHLAHSSLPHCVLWLKAAVVVVVVVDDVCCLLHLCLLSHFYLPFPHLSPHFPLFLFSVHGYEFPEMKGWDQ